MIRLLLVDDHEIVRMGLRTALARNEGFEVVGEAGSQREAISQAEALKPDVIVMDVRLPDGSGIEACREILTVMPETRVIMLTSYADEDAIVASLLAGSSGFVMKEMGSIALCQAIKTVASGGKILDASLTSLILKKMKSRGLTKIPRESLTEREVEILELIAQGKSNKEIAEVTFLSYNTVRNYVSNILHKFGFSNRSQITVYELERRHDEHHQR